MRSVQSHGKHNVRNVRPGYRDMRDDGMGAESESTSRVDADGVQWHNGVVRKPGSAKEMSLAPYWRRRSGRNRAE